MKGKNNHPELSHGVTESNVGSYLLFISNFKQTLIAQNTKEIDICYFVGVLIYCFIDIGR